MLTNVLYYHSQRQRLQQCKRQILRRGLRDLSFRRLEGITQAAVDAFLHNPLPLPKLSSRKKWSTQKNIWNICSKMVTDCGNFTEIIMDDGVGGAKAERGIFG